METLTAQELTTHADLYERAAVRWYQMADEAHARQDEFGRRYCAEVAAQQADNGRAFRHRAMLAERWPQPRPIDTAALREAIRAGEVDGIARTRAAGTL